MAPSGNQDHNNLSKSLGCVHSRIDDHADRINKLERLIKFSIFLTVVFGILNAYLKIRG